MKLSISNIAWDKSIDEKMYKILNESGYDAIEIAPTRLFSNNPYEKLSEAKQIAENLYKEYNLFISSMQSIWYGKNENMHIINENITLIKYTESALKFANIINCKNLVFGCPKNRNIPEFLLSDNQNVERNAIQFFKIIGDLAKSYNTFIGIEANPQIYNTNYLNTTYEALSLVQTLDNDGIKLNLDIGTMIQNDEKIDILYGKAKYINHVHISEPYLKCIQKRKLHKDLFKILKDENYNNYISIEMSKQENIDSLKSVIDYGAEVFNG